MNNKLVYDIGMHLGFDTKMYIEKGYNVIAVEANEHLVSKGMKKFKKEIEAGKLQIINCAISEMDNQKLSFFISDADQESSINVISGKIPTLPGYPIKPNPLFTYNF